MSTSRLFLILAVALAGCTRMQDESRLAQLSEEKLLEPPQTIAIEVKNYCPAASRAYKDLLVSNLSVGVVQGENRLDTDKDGLVDFLEERVAEELNLSPVRADSNSDGFSDLLMYLSGIDRGHQARLRCLDQSNSDGSGILYQDPLSGSQQFLGLRGCEKEQLTHTEATLFDSDGDGIPDYLELRCGLNPRDPQDALQDSDGDGLINREECKRHTPIGETNRPQAIRKLEYSYSQSTKIISGRKCIDFTIGNISILEGGDRNLVALYLIETDGLQKTYLYSAFELLGPGMAGKTVVLEFGPSPKGRFTAK